MAASRGPDIAPGRLVTRSRTNANADTSLEPDGLTRRVMLNVLEAFFRRPLLHLLPLALLLGLGLASALSTTQEFRATGVLSSTDRSLLGELTGAGPQQQFGFDTAATVTAREVNELLTTNEFLQLVIDTIGAPDSELGRTLLRDTIVQSTGASADGNSLVRISSVTDNNDLSFRITDGVMRTYVDFVVDRAVLDSTNAEEFLEQQLDAAVTQRDEAADDRDQYLIDFPQTSEADRPITQQLALDRLNSAFDRAEARVVDTQDKLEEAQLVTAQARTVTDQKLRIVDEAEVPLNPEPRLQKAVLTMALFGVLGLMLSLALVVITATLDRTIRIPNDITAKFGLEVLAVVPNTRR